MQASASEEEHPEIRLLSPDEVFSLIERLPNPINIAVLLVTATGLRISEFRWRHVLWDENKISIEQRPVDRCVPAMSEGDNEED